MYKAIYLFIVIILFVTCSQDHSVNLQTEQSVVNLQVQFVNDPNIMSKLHSQLVVSRVRVRITGPDMTEINQNLTLNGNQASGTLEVPKGPNRLFEVFGLDLQSNVLIAGEGTKNLTNDTESITITARWLSTKVSLQVSLPTSNVNQATAFVGGEGLGEEIHSESLEIIEPDRVTAVKTFDLPRGKKEFYILESVIAGGMVFELYEGYFDANLISENINLGLPVDELYELESYEDWFEWHDYSAEDYLMGTQNDMYSAGFDITDYGSVYFKTIKLAGIRWGGGSEEYRIVILDGFDLDTNTRFRSGPINPIDSPHHDNEKWWDILWEPPEKGRFDDVILAGIQYLSNTEYLGYPEIGYDKNNPDGVSTASYWYKSSEQKWYWMSDGDFLISVIIQTPAGQEVELKPVPIMNHYVKAKSILAIYK
jgi:hypothetical protein